MSKTKKLALLGVAAMAVAVAAGGAIAQSGVNSKGLIFVFMPSSSNNALAQWQIGAKAEAKKQGYDLKIVENNFDQNQQNVQVQQQLASGQKPAAYVWWPADAHGGLAAERQLSRTGVPLVMSNQFPVKGTENLITAYSGVSDTFNGKVAAKNLIAARKALLASGAKLHSKGGNVIVIGFVAGYQAGIDRLAGFKQAIAGQGFNLLTTQWVGFDAASGFKLGQQIIAANKSKGIDFVYTMNDALGVGVIQALQAEGFKPGKNVMLVSATCHGDTSALVKGTEFATGIQPINFEGLLTINTIARYFQYGKKVLPGTEFTTADPNKPPVLTGPPHKYTFTPNPAVAASDFKKTKLWGHTFQSICTY
jgi:ABC-type sugar transport system substrate-binding protein